jgi:peptidoglycan hydrolase-like protein with peptidoglycan-binding domain
MIDKRVYLLQVGLKSLGFDPGLPDGDEGPKTKSAFAAWVNSLDTVASTESTLASRIVALARTELAAGIRETSKNQGPGLAKYWTATSYPDGYANREPYCAAFVCWIIKQAVGDRKVAYNLPTSPVAYDIEKWGAANAKNGVKVLKNTDKLLPGDIFTLATASHTGIIVGVNSTTVTTIEGNTDGSGSREGDGVYEKKRTKVSLRKIVRLA